MVKNPERPEMGSTRGRRGRPRDSLRAYGCTKGISRRGSGVVAGFARRSGRLASPLAAFLPFALAGAFALACVLAFVLVCVCAFAPVPQAYADGATALPSTARPSTNGALAVEGGELVDAQGNAVRLRGVSTHGLQWFPEYVNESLFEQLSSEWDANLVRLALYSQDYCDASAEDASAMMETLRAGIDAAIAADMYVLVDWHILEDGDPNEHAAQAVEFFGQVSTEYAQSPNVIYEICNEPGAETTWAQICEYAQKVIPVIRANDPDAVIVVGTPDHDRDLAAAVRSPLSQYGSLYENVMYAFHFYVATHGQDERAGLDQAVEDGLPVFVTECGLAEADGTDRVDFDSAVQWFDYLDEHNLSYAVWSLSNKAETSALIASDSAATEHLDENDLSPVGAWVRSLLQGEEPSAIAAPAVDGDGRLVEGSSAWERLTEGLDLAPEAAWRGFALGALGLIALSLLTGAVMRLRPRKGRTYEDLLRLGDDPRPSKVDPRRAFACQATILASTFFTLVYLCWRVLYSVPLEWGWVAVACNVALLLVEALGFVESLVHFRDVAGMRAHPLPDCRPEEYPEVDIFIATYNEPDHLLAKTINGCKHLEYPDPSKVHVWLCDDNRRPEMRSLADRMGVGYFDRPDNEGAKAGNLNAALARTSAPYVVTLDADMIVQRDFLMQTIPYFIDSRRRNAGLPAERQIKLGLLQTPQCFHDPDVFQHGLYAENCIPNEQDYFYRTVEVAKTASNSVIYGGSNTVLAREALEAVGGFYTGSITEDFATGLLIESAGYVSLALPRPLASGSTPHTFAEHIQQRTRWGRGVIVTARKLGIMRRPGLTLAQKTSYWSSVVYWYSPVKNLVYLLSPLLFAVFAVPVFACSWLDLLVYWLPMFAAQLVCLRVVSQGRITTRWSGIHETAVMPHLLVPILKESLGITLSTFKVTDKSRPAARRVRDWQSMAPFIVLTLFSLVGIARVVWLLAQTRSVGLLVLLFWLVRNLYFLGMSLFLVDGRDSDGESVKVRDAEPVRVTLLAGLGSLSGPAPGTVYEGLTTQLTEHSARVYLDGAEGLRLGSQVELEVESGPYRVRLKGVVTQVALSRSAAQRVHTIEILNYGEDWGDYLQILYDRVPTLPQRLTHDPGPVRYFWRNLAARLGRTG